MFTGIIRHVGAVRSARPAPGGGRRLAIDLGGLAEGLRVGDSVAVSGACLTVAALSAPAAEFDLVRETLQRTTLGELRPGSKVNLERSLRVGEGLDGHLVQGHVDGVARVSRIDRGPGFARTGHGAAGGGGQWTVEFSAGPELTGLMVPKGSVAVDGVSLTLVDVTARGFSVALIPTTLAETTLGALRAGSRVNVETDVIGKYVRNYLAGLSRADGLTPEKLKEERFAR